jgi:hypothetical protein
LPESSAQSASFYVFSMEHSGQLQLWELLTRLMEAAGRPLCTLHGQPPLQQLLPHDGYGFGILSAPHPYFDWIPRESPKLLFLRDPRYMLQSLYWSLQRQPGAAGKPASFTQFLTSPLADQVIGRYWQYAECWHKRESVTVLRYERAIVSWTLIAAEIIARLRLPIDPTAAATLAARSPAIGDRLTKEVIASSHSTAPGPTEQDLIGLDRRLADVLAALGYRAHTQPAPGAADTRPEQDTPAPSRGRVRPRTWSLGAIFEPDPVLFNRLKPNSSAEMYVLGRHVLMDVDAGGCRPVIGQPTRGDKTLAVYGCSFTYGLAINAEETFCSHLQQMFPTWRIENHGVSAYGTIHNLVQLERNLRLSQPELVTFCWIEQHLFRNVADVPWVQNMSMNMGRPALRAARTVAPRAALGPDGALELRSIQVPRHDLTGFELQDFTHDPHYLELVCFRLLERARALVSDYGGHFFVTTLWRDLPTTLRQKLAESSIPVLDASLRGDHYLCIPDDPHPNALANREFAARLRDYLLHQAGRHQAGEPHTGQHHTAPLTATATVTGAAEA